jgi:hypothetical protein
VLVELHRWGEGAGRVRALLTELGFTLFALTPPFDRRLGNDEDAGAILARRPQPAARELANNKLLLCNDLWYTAVLGRTSCNRARPRPRLQAVPSAGPRRE